MAKEALVVLGTLVGVVIAISFLAGGVFNIGSNAGSPYFNVGFKGHP